MFGLEEILRPGETTIGMPLERVNGRRLVRTNAMSVSGFAIIFVGTVDGGLQLTAPFGGVGNFYKEKHQTG